MIRITTFVFLAALCFSCSSAKKYFRPLNKNESTAIKSAKKTFGKMHNAYRVLIITDAGNMVARLYDETPLHRDNFISKVKAGFYDSLLFHRVIKDFMIQGGDPQSKNAKPGEMLGSGEASGGRIPAEIRTDIGIYHKKGVLAAARDNNPEKASSNCQFYIAQGKVFTPEQLDSAARRRGYTLTADQIKLYTTTGGIPHLDGNYTVYGELESGFDVLDKIAAVKTGAADRPVADVKMSMFVITEKRK